MEIVIEIKFSRIILYKIITHAQKKHKISDQLKTCPHYWILRCVNVCSLGCIIKSITSHSIHRCYVQFDVFKMLLLELFNSSGSNICACVKVCGEPSPHQLMKSGISLMFLFLLSALNHLLKLYLPPSLPPCLSILIIFFVVVITDF